MQLNKLLRFGRKKSLLYITIDKKNCLIITSSSLRFSDENHLLLHVLLLLPIRWVPQACQELYLVFDNLTYT